MLVLTLIGGLTLSLPVDELLCRRAEEAWHANKALLVDIKVPEELKSFVRNIECRKPA